MSNEKWNGTKEELECAIGANIARIRSLSETITDIDQERESAFQISQRITKYEQGLVTIDRAIEFENKSYRSRVEELKSRYQLDLERLKANHEMQMEITKNSYDGCIEELSYRREQGLDASRQARENLPKQALRDSKCLKQQRDELNALVERQLEMLKGVE